MNFLIFGFIILFDPAVSTSENICLELAEMKDSKWTYKECVQSEEDDKNAPFIFKYQAIEETADKKKTQFPKLEFLGLPPGMLENGKFIFVIKTGVFAGCPAVTQEQAEIENKLFWMSGYVLFIQEYNSYQEKVTCEHPPKILHTQCSSIIYDENGNPNPDRGSCNVTYKINPDYVIQDVSIEEGDDKSEKTLASIPSDRNKSDTVPANENNSTLYSWFYLPAYVISAIRNYLPWSRESVEETKQPLLTNEDGKAADSESEHREHLDETVQPEDEINDEEIHESEVDTDTEDTVKKNSTENNTVAKLEDIILFHVRTHFDSSSTIWALYRIQNLYLYPNINNTKDDTEIFDLSSDEQHTRVFDASPLYEQMLNTLKHVFSAYAENYSEINKPFLVPMQLISMHDFLTYPMKNATYSHILYAPMWKSTIKNWRFIEKTARSLSQKLGIFPLTVYSGAYGIMTYEGKELYLGKTKTNKQSSDGDDTIRVPNTFWKCLVSEDLDKGIVIATSNDPFAENPEDLCDEKVTCGNLDVSEDEIKTGGFYCCKLSETLVQKIEIHKKHSEHILLNLKDDMRYIRAMHKVKGLPYWIIEGRNEPPSNEPPLL